MLTTLLGKIKVYADGVCIDYTATEYDFDRPPCKDKPVAGCYRIEIDTHGRNSISCVVELTEPIRNTGSSGEKYIYAEFIKDETILTIGMEDENPAFESVRTKCGVQYHLLQTVNKVVFGIAWATDYEGPSDCRTWYAADPTLDK